MNNLQGSFKNTAATPEAVEKETRDRVQTLKAQYRERNIQGGDWQEPLHQLTALYGSHLPEKKDSYQVGRLKSDIREIINRFTVLSVAENHPEAALDMLAAQHDQPSTPENVMEIGRAHASNRQGTPHIPQKAAKALENVYHAAQAADVSVSPQRQLVMKNAMHQMTKLARRLAKGSVAGTPEFNLPGMKVDDSVITSAFNQDAMKAKATDKAAVQVLPQIIEALENMDGGDQKLRYLEKRGGTIPGLPNYLKMVDEALRRIEERREALEKPAGQDVAAGARHEEPDQYFNHNLALN